MTEQQNQGPARKHGGDTDLHRRQRGKNLAVLATLVAFIVIIYVVAMVRMSGGSFP
jgi:hypothetical protein